MSKTVDDLVDEFLKHWLAHGRMEDDIRAGIIAVVTALRDELVREFERCDCCSGIEHVEPFFEEILAPREGGSREAGGPTREDGRSVEQLAATSSHAVTAPATAPAPAVCEWTDVGKGWDTGCGGWDTAWSSANGKIICSICKAAIKFTEAQR